MKKQLFPMMLVLSLCALFFSNVFAAEENAVPYDITLTEAYSFSDETETRSCRISVPEIHGLKDAEEEAALNEELRSFAEEVQRYYEDMAAEFDELYKPEEQPHYMTELSYDIIYENDERLVFKTEYIYIVASASVFTSFYSIDKQTGSLIPLSDYLPDSFAFDAVTLYLRSEMQAINETEPTNMYWVNDDSIETSVAVLETSRHWYPNEENQLVVWFDKYEVAPGASGSSSFIIPQDLVK